MTRYDQQVKVIETESDHEQAIAHLSRLMDEASEIDAEIKLQALVIENYERRTLGANPEVDLSNAYRRGWNDAMRRRDGEEKSVECMCGLCKLERSIDLDAIHSCHAECDNPICVRVRKAVEAEREACAKVCEDAALLPDAGPLYCAAAIRARGEA